MKEYTMNTRVNSNGEFKKAKIEVGTVQLEQYNVVIDINDWYSIDYFKTLGFNILDLISEDFESLNNGDIFLEIKRQAHMIDVEINENLIENTWREYHKDVEDFVRENYYLAEETVVNVIFKGMYENTKKYVNQNANELVEEFKYWTIQQIEENYRIQEMTEEEIVKEIEELHRDALPEWLYKNHDDECK